MAFSTPTPISGDVIPRYRLLILYLNLGSNNEAKTFLSRNGKIIIRMRGLPFDAGSKDVVSILNLIIFQY